MTKSKASLKGRGVDILLGGSAEPEETVAPATGNVAPAKAGAGPAPTTPAPTSVDVNPFAEPASAASFAESAATAFDVNPFAEPAAQPDVESSGAATTEAAAGSAFESEIVSSQPSAPVATSLPPEETPWLADESPAIPQVDEMAAASFTDSGPVSVSLPNDPTLSKTISIGGLFMDMPSIPNPESFTPTTDLTQTGLDVVGVSETKQTTSEDEVLRRIGQERIQQVAKRIDELYAEVAKGTMSDAEAGKTLRYLLQARDKSLEDQRQYDEAEYLVNVAQYFVTRANNVRADSRSFGVAVLFYGLVWLIAFGAGLFFELTGLFQTWLATFIPSSETVPVVSGFFATLMAGGIGGVLGVLYSLFKHVAVRRDFDRQFVMWYIVQPFLGLLMGFIMHLFLVAGVFQLMNATGDAFRFIGLLIAVAAAFRQHYVFAWLERLLKAFDRGSSQVAGAAGSAESAASSIPELPANPPRPPSSSEPAAGVG